MCRILFIPPQSWGVFMVACKKKHRDLAMRIICDFYMQHKSDCEISTKYLYLHGLPESVDAEHLCSVLEGMGYLAMTRFYDHPSRIDLTDSGKCYFERKSDRNREKRAENIRYAITTIIAILALIISGVSLAAQLGLIQLPTP